MTSQSTWAVAHQLLVSLGYTNYEESKSRHGDIQSHIDWLCEQTSNIAALMSRRPRCMSHWLLANNQLHTYGYSEWFIAKIGADSNIHVCIDARERIKVYSALLHAYVDELITNLIVEYC